MACAYRYGNAPEKATDLVMNKLQVEPQLLPPCLAPQGQPLNSYLAVPQLQAQLTAEIPPGLFLADHFLPFAIWSLTAAPVLTPSTSAALRWLNPADRTSAHAAAARAIDPPHLSRKCASPTPYTVTTVPSVSSTVRQVC